MGAVYQTLCGRRTIRRFKQKPISEKLLPQLLNTARMAPSGSNIQPCQYILVTDNSLTKQIFPLLKWAGYIAPAGDPAPGEEPVVYIMVLIDLAKKKKGGEVDAAAAISNILNAAWEQGIGTCWLKSINRKEIKKIFKIPHYLAVDSVIAMGYPDEKPVAVPMKDSVKYWKDPKGVLHVPKRPMTEISHKNGFGKNFRITDKMN